MCANLNCSPLGEISKQIQLKETSGEKKKNSRFPTSQQCPILSILGRTYLITVFILLSFSKPVLIQDIF